ncbi:hypothetical protein AB0E69_34975 [Kribbella sp. NPDC026611]|uniref:hypothetical protein n=1 Tax=Kribbella sp. NPDC026611 TaxID=3154911 RepID=UPI0034078FE5
MTKQPLGLWPANPRYFRFRGEPTVLITSAEHYGAVLNLDFDYVRYLGTLQRHRFNYTRAASGAFVERKQTIEGSGWENPYAPRPSRFVAPWRRTEVPGYAHGGTRFDLTAFEPAYFDRLDDFVNQAGLRGIVVEFTIFTAMFSASQWGISPMNTVNNINELPPLAWDEVYRVGNGGLLDHQLALTRRLTEALVDHDNVLIEIFNEPYFGNVEPAWTDRIDAEIAKVFADRGRRVPVSWNIANQRGIIRDTPSTANVFTFHYATPEALTDNPDVALPVIDDETGYAGVGDRPYRREAWRFLLSGGSGFNHLDYSFAPGQEDGSRHLPETASSGGGPRLRSQLTFLRDFLYSVPFADMTPMEVIAPGGEAVGLARSGRAYAWYMTAVESRVSVSFEVAAGNYMVCWSDPVGLVTTAPVDIDVDTDGTITLSAPAGTANEWAGTLLRRTAASGDTVATFDFAAAARTTG